MLSRRERSYLADSDGWGVTLLALRHADGEHLVGDRRGGLRAGCEGRGLRRRDVLVRHARGALLGVSGALLGVSGALLGVSGALLGVSGALLGVLRAASRRRLRRLCRRLGGLSGGRGARPPSWRSAGLGLRSRSQPTRCRTPAWRSGLQQMRNPLRRQQPSPPASRRTPPSSRSRRWLPGCSRPRCARPRQGWDARRALCRLWHQLSLPSSVRYTDPPSSDSRKAGYSRMISSSLSGSA